MLIHTIPPAILLASALYVLWSVKDEDRRIDEATEANTGDLDHGPLLLRRVLWCGVGLFALFLLNLWTGTTQWSLLLYAGMAWGTFVPPHRYLLNRKRGNWWFYMSNTGNAYDRSWTWVAYFLKRTIRKRRKDGKINWPSPRDYGCTASELVFRATLAYATETLTLLATLAGFYWMTWN